MPCLQLVLDGIHCHRSTFGGAERRACGRRQQLRVRDLWCASTSRSLSADCYAIACRAGHDLICDSAIVRISNALAAARGSVGARPSAHKAWSDRMRQDAIHLDHGPDQAIKRPVFNWSVQSHAEDFQQPTNLVGQIHCPLEQSFTRAQKLRDNRQCIQLRRAALARRKPCLCEPQIHIEHDRSGTSHPAKYSIFCLPCSQLCCDPIGNSAKVQGQPNYACFPPLLLTAENGPKRTFALPPHAAL